MSLQKGYDAMPEELRAYPETLGFYGNYHGGANAAIITSDQYFNYLPSQRMPEDEFCSGSNISGPIFQRLADGTPKSMSYEYDNFRHQFHYPRQPLEQVGSGGSPGEREAASFECQAMYDSEPSSSPASAVSPECVAPSTQVPSPLEFAHQPDYVSNKHQPHKHFQTHSPTSSSSPVGMGDEMSVQHLCNMRGQMSVKHDNHHLSQTHRGPKRRATDTIDAPVPGNRKERRRTQSINTAFAELRDCIPNVPADTKLSKIKTLRLATSYIAYLTEMVSRDDNMNTDMDTMNGLVDTIGSAGALPILRADFAMGTRPMREAIKHESLKNECETTGIKRKRNRTGWPEHVWALELQH